MRVERSVSSQISTLGAKVEDLQLKVSSMQVGASTGGGAPTGGGGASGAAASGSGGSSTAAPDNEAPPQKVTEEMRKQRVAEKRRETMISKYASEEIFGVDDSRQLPDTVQSFAYYLRKGIILPFGRFRQSWDFGMVIAAMYVVTILPYRIAFSEEHSVGYAIFEFLLDIIFMSDVVLNFLTAHYSDDGSIVTSHRAIALRYARSWLVPDLISSIPVRRTPL